MSPTVLRLRRFALAAGVLSLTAALGQAQTPSNDECTTAIPLLIGQNGPFDSTGATSSATPWTCGITAGADVWHSFVAPCTGRVTFNTCGSSFDTVLEVYEGTCSALVSVGCGDDECATQSEVSHRLTFGSTYFLRVGSNGGADGTYSVEATHHGAVGSFVTIPTGCTAGGVTLSASGQPTIGGQISFDLSGVTGSPSIWFGPEIAPSIPICPAAGCALGAGILITVPVTSVPITVPCDPSVLGLPLATQGADLRLNPGACPPSGTIDVIFTDTIRTTIL